MVRTFSDWLFNVMLWGAIIATVVLTYEAFSGPFVLHNPIAGLISLGVIAVLSVIWPRL